MAKKSASEKMRNMLNIEEEPQNLDEEQILQEVDAAMAAEAGTVIRKDKKSKKKQQHAALIEDEVDTKVAPEEVPAILQKKRTQMATPMSKEQRQKLEPTVRLFEPIDYADAEAIGQSLVHGQITYVQLHRLTDIQANRLIDYLTGVVYGIRGDIQRVSEEMFICTPRDVEITDELLTRFATK